MSDQSDKNATNIENYDDVTTSHVPDSQGTSLNLLEPVFVVVKHRKLIISATLCVFLLSIVISLLLPNIYTATSRLLPPSPSQYKSPLITELESFSSFNGVQGGSPSSDIYIGMLQSRTIADAIIERFDLMSRYDMESRIKTYELLREKIIFSKNDDNGIVVINVADNDPAMAANLANAYVDELMRLNIKINLNSAGRERLFLEDRLVVVKEKLATAENILAEFQKKNKTIEIDEQSEAIIEALGKLKGELAIKEVELGMLLTYQTEGNPRVKALKEEINQLKTQINRREQTPSDMALSGDIFLVTSEMPQLGKEYRRLMREFRIQEAVYETLIKQFELAKIEEAKNTTVIQVLDEAIAPDKKTKPRRAVIVLVMTFFGFVAAVISSFLLEYKQTMHEDDRQLWNKIKDEIRRNKQPI